MTAKQGQGVKIDMNDVRAYSQFRQMEQNPEIRKKIEQLEERIKRIQKGESTGNRAEDFELVFMLEEYLNDSHPVQEIQSKVKVGKSVLVVEQDEGIHGCPGIFAPSEIRPENLGIDTTMLLGMMSADLEYDMKNGRIIFPTEGKHAATIYGPGRGWQLKEGNITMDTYRLANLGKIPERRTHSVPNTFGLRYQSGTHIFIADEVDTFLSMGARLKEPFYEKEVLVLSYVDAMRLIGHEAPQKFIDAYDKRLYEERAAAVINIYENVTAVRHALVNQEQIKRQYFSYDGEKERKEREAAENVKKTETAVKKDLENALKLRMHDCTMVYDAGMQGVSINVPDFIKGLCEKFSVKIPE
jgi:hypothetical protein